jgi:hypothetical protein
VVGVLWASNDNVCLPGEAAPRRHILAKELDALAQRDWSAAVHAVHHATCAETLGITELDTVDDDLA